MSTIDAFVEFAAVIREELNPPKSKPGDRLTEAWRAVQTCIFQDRARIVDLETRERNLRTAIRSMDGRIEQLAVALEEAEAELVRAGQE